MKKLSAILISVILTATMLLSLVSCGVDYTEDEIKATITSLIEASYDVNEIFFGRGLAVDDTMTDISNDMADAGNVDEADVEVSTVQYDVVSEDCGYTSIDDLKNAALSVYTEEYCETFFESTFDGISDENSDNVIYARFIINLYDQLAQRSDVKDEGAVLGRDYDFDTIKIVKMSGSECKFTIDYTYTEATTDEDGNTTETDETMSATLTVKKENGTWRLDSPTYYIATVTD